MAIIRVMASQYDLFKSSIMGALNNCIDAHGPITRRWVDSAAKRIIAQMKCEKMNAIGPNRLMDCCNDQPEMKSKPVPSNARFHYQLVCVECGKKTNWFRTKPQTKKAWNLINANLWY